MDQGILDLLLFAALCRFTQKFSEVAECAVKNPFPIFGGRFGFVFQVGNDFIEIAVQVEFCRDGSVLPVRA